MSSRPPQTSETVVCRFRLNGQVQGVGMRPAIARLAHELNLAGRVSNSLHGVFIEVVGSLSAVEKFHRELPHRFPAEAVVDVFESEALPAPLTQDFDRSQFRIEVADQPQTTSTATGSQPFPTTRVPPDRAVCDDCLREFATPSDRRYQYPFTTCTHCGPRFSILERLPYERFATGMRKFALCNRCEAECASPTNRRFHSQTNACPDCGPQVVLWQADEVLERGESAMARAAQSLGDGQIVAVRGVGGYQLFVDATSAAAVRKLRERKRRRKKPLAVLVKDIATAETLAILNDGERQELCSSANPIVIVARKVGVNLCQEISGELNSLGLLLPTTPLHRYLAQTAGSPLVCTSANFEGEPILFQHADLPKLAELADFVLDHDRPIERPIDDSVVRVMGDRPVTIRLARGLAPLPLPIDLSTATIAFGGHQKSSFAIGRGGQGVLAPHVGDLDSLATRDRYLSQIEAWKALLHVDDFDPVYDLHPAYFSSRTAVEHGDTKLAVQHHHAHIAATLLEHGMLDRSVLGVAMDGTGLGLDGLIWGSEFLLGTVDSFQRVGRLRPFRLPGNEQAIREPFRVALSLVADVADPTALSDLVTSRPNGASILSILNQDQFSAWTTSAGRLFDGVACLILGKHSADYEGDLAMMLEAACDPAAEGEYSFAIQPRDFTPREIGESHEIPEQSTSEKVTEPQRSDTLEFEVDWRPMIVQLLHDVKHRIPRGVMAMRFHRGLASVIQQASARFPDQPAALGGGVFQNRVLVELLVNFFRERNRADKSSQKLLTPGRIPPNDGGLAAGQIAIASRVQQVRSKA